MSDRGPYRSFYCAITDDADAIALSDRAFRVLALLKLSLPASGIGIPVLLQLAQRANCTPKQLDTALAELERPQSGAVRGWIVRDRNIVWLVNGLRHEPNMRPKDAKHRKYVVASLAVIGDKTIARDFRAHYPEWFSDAPPTPIDTPDEVQTRPLEGPSEAHRRGIEALERIEGKGEREKEILPPPSSGASVREIRPTAAATELPLHVALAVAANQAVTEVWGESPQPYLGTGTQAIALADRIGRAEIPPAFAVRAVFTTCRAFCEAAKSRGDPKRRPGGLSYFGPAVDEAWQQQQAAALAASTPTVTPLPDVKGFATPDPWAAVKRLAEGKVA